MRIKQNHTGLSVVFLFLVFCTTVCATAVYFVHANTRAATETVPSLQVDGNVKMGTIIDSEGRQKELDAIVEEGMVAFSINATPFMISGRGKTNLYIENPPENRNRFTATIVRDDAGEKVYRSGCLDPEQYVDGAALDVELDRGEYACTVNFDTHRTCDNSYIGRAAAQITLYVLG